MRPAERKRGCFGAKLLAILLLLFPCLSFADQIRVATASNFRIAMSAIAVAFEKQSRHEITLISGSSGKHYAQIVNGAPFDAFFSADAERPARLEEEGIAIPGSRITYAIGRLALWSPQAGYVDSNGDVLKHGDYRYLAIANPDLAPYGRAAREALQSLGVWDTLGDRLVRGENINQALQFVHSGNAELGLIAVSQLETTATGGSHWRLPQPLYRVIEQQAVMLRDNEATRDLMSFIRSDEARRIIVGHGYDTAEIGAP